MTRMQSQMRSPAGRSPNFEFSLRVLVRIHVIGYPIYTQFSEDISRLLGLVPSR